MLELDAVLVNFKGVALGLFMSSGMLLEGGLWQHLNTLNNVVHYNYTFADSYLTYIRQTQTFQLYIVFNTL